MFEFAMAIATDLVQSSWWLEFLLWTSCFCEILSSVLRMKFCNLRFRQSWATRYPGRSYRKYSLDSLILQDGQRGCRLKATIECSAIWAETLQFKICYIKIHPSLLPEAGCDQLNIYTWLAALPCSLFPTTRTRKGARG